MVNPASTASAPIAYASVAAAAAAAPSTAAATSTTANAAAVNAVPVVAANAANPAAAATATATANAPSGPVSLYVGELSNEVTESILYELFSQLGQVASIRVCRDAITRRSLGYAYVNYHTYAEAERALEALNYTVIKGQPCRIMWSQRDPSLRKSGNGNVFIKNLDKSIDTKALHDVFVNFGNILSCKVVSDSNGSKGFGFVHFETQESAEMAIEKVNGMLLNDKKVFVALHVSRRERSSSDEDGKAKFTNIYVKNLDLSVTEEEFNAMFSQYGAVTSAVVQTDENGNSKGFGFVNFEEPESAQAAIDALNETEHKGQKLFVGKAQKKSERESELRRAFEQQRLERMSKYMGINLYVKNLEESVDDEKLRAEFSVYGNISSAKVMRDEKGTSRGFGFVCFSTADEASKAVTEMNGRMIGSKPIYVALAQRKEIRRHQLEATHAQRNQLRMQQAQAAMYGPGQPIFYGAAGPRPGQPGAFIPGYGPAVPNAGPMMQPRPRWANAGNVMPGNGQPRNNGGYPGQYGGRPPMRNPAGSFQQQQQMASQGKGFAGGRPAGPGANRKNNAPGVNAQNNRPSKPANDKGAAANGNAAMASLQG